MKGKHRHHKHKKAREQAARLAPPEERAPRAPSGNGGAPADSYADGTIVVDTSDLNTPRGFGDDEEDDGSRIFGVERVVLVILLGVLAFAAFVAWQISRMPPK
ncbi:MAG TPA: hypothetical protein VER08_08185 [Pyrinomonadaceae bacterium]|nr:hypothetical protein [Pyrinomonadaceae bacterium]